MRTFYNNIKKWLLHAKVDAAVIEDVSNKTEFTIAAETNIAIWDGSDKQVEITISALLLIYALHQGLYSGTNKEYGLQDRWEFRPLTLIYFIDTSIEGRTHPLKESVA